MIPRSFWIPAAAFVISVTIAGLSEWWIRRRDSRRYHQLVNGGIISIEEYLAQWAGDRDDEYAEPTVTIEEHDGYTTYIFGTYPNDHMVQFFRDPFEDLADE